MASRTPVGRLIDRFIASTHPRAPLAGQGDMIVRVGQRYGVDPRLLAAIARKESEFGTTSGRYRFNPGGWGVKLGPSVYTSRSWEEGFSKIAKGLAGSLYKGSGLTTPAQIFMRYAPPSENNTTQYISQVNTWMRQMGANPNQSVFGPQTTASNAAANTNAATSPGGSTSEQYAEVTRMVPGQIDKNRLMMLLGNQRQRSLRGLMPAPGFRSELSKLAQSALPRAETVYTARNVGRQVQRAAAPVSQMPKWTAGGGPEAHHSRALGNWQSDDAYDLMGKTGDPVFAGVNGVVTKVSGKPGGDPGFAGYGITVKTNQGEFFFKHLGSKRVKVGQRINPHTVLGTLDATTAGGPHLHLGGTSRSALDNLYRWYLSGGRR